MKKYIFTILVASISMHIQANPQTFDLTPVLQDRYEKDCAVRSDYDLYKFPDISKKLQTYVVKNELEEEPAFVSNVFILKNVEYRGVPVTKIEFSYGNLAKQMNQALYFDLSTAKAKQSFSKIQFKRKQTKADASLDITKEGNMTSVYCSWTDQKN
ncbi:hypothetical protein [Acinetobacter modestus]|uniref:Uncharacterized protein n=1 Tax=Acinetobacter modestus TaxID=1776740 RepID=A0ABP2TV40_9GAMM|nr:hypothetical protein [Acinetobacter modestus]ENU26168.1 hypothetical protein F992_02502 [Acinetobacter modestus]GGA12512.1 hypothetical protein GCM10017554_05680 [Acinetobacter modestus]